MSEKIYSYDSKTGSLLKNGEFWLDGGIDTACNHKEICNELNRLNDISNRRENIIRLLIEENYRLRLTIIHSQDLRDIKWLKEDIEWLKKNLRKGLKELREGVKKRDIMITYENEYGKQNKLTVTEFKEELEKLENKGYGDYIVLIGYDSNSCYTSADKFRGVETDEDNLNYVSFDTDTTF